MAADEFFKWTPTAPEPRPSHPPGEEPRAPRPSGSGRARSTPAFSRLNDALSVYVAGSAIFAAVPVALNRPQLWLIWVGLTALATLIYLALSWRIDAERPLLCLRHKLMFGLALVIPGYALVQTLPVLGVLVKGPPVPEALSPSSISLMPGASLMGALRFLGYILFAGLAIEVASRTDRARRIGRWIFWGVVLHAVWALVALNMLGDISVWGADKSDYLGSATGTFVNRNSFATFLAMGAVLGLALLLEQIDKPLVRKARSVSVLTPERLDEVVIWVGLAVIGVALLSTQSRMGVFAAGTGLATCFLIMRWKAGVSLRRAVFNLAVIVVVLLVVGLMIYGQDLIWRYVFSGRDGDTRGEAYVYILGLIAERPVLGFGWDTFRPAFEMRQVAPMNTDKLWDRAHSTYLSHWTELGLIVGSIPLVIAYLAAKRLLETLRARSRDYAFGVAGLSILVTAALHSLVDFSFEMPANVILMLAILGLGSAHRSAPKPREEDTVR